MRRNFVQILKDAQIDIKAEYQKLYGLLYSASSEESISVYDVLSKHFIDFYFRGTCLSIDEFNDSHGFHFEKEPVNFSIDDLISLCEYIYNMLMGYLSIQSPFDFGVEFIDIPFYIEQIDRVIEKIGYEKVTEGTFSIFVEKTPAAIAVSESPLIPEDISYRLISYNHHAMRGNLSAKKDTLLKLAPILEAKRNDLRKADQELETNLFYIFNNLNIRHNNTDPNLKGKYKSYVSQMPNDELEKWYDETYQMCLLAFLQIENLDRKNEFKELKAAIEGNN